MTPEVEASVPETYKLVDPTGSAELVARRLNCLICLNAFFKFTFIHLLNFSRCF